jgi:hypothetical protein
MNVRLIHQSRLGILPLLGAPGITPSDRRGKADIETTSQVTSNCHVNLPASRRHDDVLVVLVDTIQKSGDETRVNRYSSTRNRSHLHHSAENHRSDLLKTPISFFAGFHQNMEKYRQLGPTIISFYIGGLG